jgi:hypothetical protein
LKASWQLRRRTKLVQLETQGSFLDGSRDPRPSLARRTRQQQLLVVFVRARKASDPIDGGISTRLLGSFPVLLGG